MGLELKLVDGAYVPNRFLGLESVSGMDALLQRISMKLQAKRGAFLPLPEFGSRLYTLSTVKPSMRETAAKQFVQEALSDEAGLVLDSLEIVYEGEDTITVATRFSLEGGTQLSVNTRI